MTSDTRRAFADAADACRGTQFTKADNASIRYQFDTSSTDIYHIYNFITRTLCVRLYNKENFHVIPFREVDPDVLHFMREKLIDLGGTPPPLPAQDASTPTLHLHKGPAA